MLEARAFHLKDKLQSAILVQLHVDDLMSGLRLNAKPVIVAKKFDCGEHSEQGEKKLATWQKAKKWKTDSPKQKKEQLKSYPGKDLRNTNRQM